MLRPLSAALAGWAPAPGGRSDPGETPWQTALREAEEEIGLDPAHVTLAGLSTPYRTGTGGRREVLR